MANPVTPMCSVILGGVQHLLDPPMVSDRTRLLETGQERPIDGLLPLGGSASSRSGSPVQVQWPSSSHRHPGLSIGLPAEIKARRELQEHLWDRLLILAEATRP